MSTALRLLAAWTLVVGCSPVEEPTELHADLPVASMVIRGVTLVDMKHGTLVEDQSIAIDGDRILAVAASKELAVEDEAAAIVEAEGLYAFPGLIDMHVHLLPGLPTLPQYLPQGVTSVRNLWGFDDYFEVRDDIEAGEISGPTVYSVSPGLDGTPVTWPGTQVVTAPALARGIVEKQVAAGFTELKIYQNLTREPYDAIAAAAKEFGVEFLGHVPHRVGLDAALAAGQSGIEHMSGFGIALGGNVVGANGWKSIDRSRIPNVAAAVKASGAWVCPTMWIFAQFLQGDPTANESRRLMLKALHDADVPLLVGTDAGILGRPARTIHDELAEFVAAGLTPFEALQGATTQAAQILRASEDIGTIEAGMRADLLLLSANPLDDVGALRSLEMVVSRGDTVEEPVPNRE